MLPKKAPAWLGHFSLAFTRRARPVRWPWGLISMFALPLSDRSERSVVLGPIARALMKEDLQLRTPH